MEKNVFELEEKLRITSYSKNVFNLGFGPISRTNATEIN